MVLDDGRLVKGKGWGWYSFQSEDVGLKSDCRMVLFSQ